MDEHHDGMQIHARTGTKKSRLIYVLLLFVQAVLSCECCAPCQQDRKPVKWAMTMSATYWHCYCGCKHPVPTDHTNNSEVNNCDHRHYKYARMTLASVNASFVSTSRFKKVKGGSVCTANVTTFYFSKILFIICNISRKNVNRNYNGLLSETTTWHQSGSVGEIHVSATQFMFTASSFLPLFTSTEFKSRDSSSILKKIYSYSDAYGYNF